MKGTLSTSLTALNTLSPDLKDVVDTSVITNAMDQTTALQEVCKNLSTEECAAKQARQQAENDAAQLKFYQDTLAASITKLRGVRTLAQTRLDDMLRAKGSSPAFKGESILPQVEAVISRIDGDIKVLEKSVPYINPPVSTSLLGSSSSGSTRPDYSLPVTQSAVSYKTELDALNLQYKNLMGIQITEAEARETFVFWAKNTFIPILFYCSLAYAALIGGITCANMYTEEKSLLNRLYYFFYGMLGSPAVLAYCAINPPFWTSIVPMAPRLSVFDVSPTPPSIEVVNGKYKKTMDGIPAPTGMAWIKKNLALDTFTYLLSLKNAADVTAATLPSLPGGLQWASKLGDSTKTEKNTPQTLWYVEEIPIKS
jgi:hypothetical protein